MVAPHRCPVVTELMPTRGDLWRQRLRWQRGAVENLGSYGSTLTTLRYWAQQLAIGYGTLALVAYLICMAVLIGAADSWVSFLFWIIVGIVFAIERVVTAWPGDSGSRVVAVRCCLPELLYDLYLDAVFVLRAPPRSPWRGRPSGGTRRSDV